MKRHFYFLLISGLISTSLVQAADTLLLRDGSSLKGTFIGGNDKAVTFKTRRGVDRFPLEELEGIEFDIKRPSAAAVKMSKPIAAVALAAGKTLPAGHILTLKTTSKLHNSMDVGQKFGLIAIAGVAPNTRVFGVVTRARRGRLRKPGTLAFKVSQIVVNGTAIPVQTNEISLRATPKPGTLAKSTARFAMAGELFEDKGRRRGSKVGLAAGVLRRRAQKKNIMVPPGTVVDFKLLAPAKLP